MDLFYQDLRYGLRTLRKNPGFAATAILILAVAIGASAAMFSIVDALVLRPLPYHVPEQLVTITESFKKFDITGMQLAAVELDDVRAMTRSFSGLAGIRSDEFTLTGRGAADRIPFGRQGGSSVRVVGRPVDPRAPQLVVRPSRVLPGYFESLGVPLLHGRTFTAADSQGRTPVAIIDEAAAAKLFANGEEPLGRQVTGVEPGLTATIVGVVGAVKRRGPAAAPEMSVYHAATQKAGTAMTFTVKTAMDPLALIPAIRHALAELDPLLPLTRTVTMEHRLADSLARRRLSMQLLMFFGSVALLLAAIGLYGVLSYVANQRRREVGIRVALGAQPRQVIELIVAKQGLWPMVTRHVTRWRGT